MSSSSAHQTVSKHRDDCAQLLEQIHKLLDAIIILHVKSDTGEMPLDVLNHIGKFTEYFSCLMVLTGH
jgi:hypothetical protein